METVRLRFVFQDHHILSRLQKLEGLKRSWLLLKPQHETISDLSSHLIHIFDLDHSCPNGLLLYMDGFVLPPFESTCILKDKDIISVKKKGGKSSDIIKAGGDAKLIEEEEIVEKQPVLTNVPLLTNREFKKESGGHQSELEEDEDYHAGDVPFLTNGEFEKESGGHQSELEEDEDYHAEDKVHVGNSSGGNAASKKRKASQKLKSTKRKKKRPMVPEAVNCIHTEEVENCNDIFESMPTANSCDQLQGNDTESVDVSAMPDGTKKVPSRSARRKKARRQWLRQLTEADKKELNWRQTAKKDMHKNSTGRKGLMAVFPNQNSDAEDEIIPIVIKPGHIRFESLRDQFVQQNQVPPETPQWNGITGKRRTDQKGKKRCKEKGSNSLSVKRNDYQDFRKECSETPTIENEVVINDPIDFDKLKPFTSLPKEGDVIAYRLLELSSSWTPELSSFRVGKTSLYDPGSNRVVLIPVPEYSIPPEKEVDGDTSAQLKNSLYREEGSLEMDFSSLLDVRIVKCGNSDTVSGSEKEVNVWEEITQALSAKKAWLSQERGWSRNSGWSSWSNRALRSSALGSQIFEKRRTWSNHRFSKSKK